MTDRQLFILTAGIIVGYVMFYIRTSITSKKDGNMTGGDQMKNNDYRG